MYLALGTIKNVTMACQVCKETNDGGCIERSVPFFNHIRAKILIIFFTLTFVSAIAVFSGVAFISWKDAKAKELKREAEAKLASQEKELLNKIESAYTKKKKKRYY